MNLSTLGKFLTVIVFGLASTARAADAQSQNATDERISKLEDRILELEAQNSLNRFRLSGILINRFESMQNDHGVPGAVKTRDEVHPVGMFFGLNADFDVTKRLKIYSTLGMSKFFNNEGRSESLTSSNYATYQATEMGSWGYGGSLLHVDRAYASYEFENMPLTLAIGRMPTKGGPPLNQLDGMPREGTYPRFIFNAIFDGIAAVYDFSHHLPQNHSLKLRAFYQPFVFVDPGDRTKQWVDGKKAESRVDQGAVLAEYAITDLKFLKRFDFMYMHAWWNNFYVGTTTPAPEGQPPTGQWEDGTDDGFYFGFEDIGGHGTNISYTALLYRAIDSGLPDVQKNAWGHLLNINQKIPRLHDLILGGEYIKTENYFYLDDWTRLNIIPFYTMQSSQGVHVFASMPLDEKITGRVGYYRLKAGTGDVWQPEESEAYSVYAQVRIDF